LMSTETPAWSTTTSSTPVLPRGSAPSSPPATSRREKLTSAIFGTCSQLSFADFDSAASSPELAAGRTPSVSPDGPTTVRSGPDPVLVSLSARQAKERGFLTSGTCGPRGSTSSASAALQSFLASRLRVRTASRGSTLFKLTWKERVTPSGRRICALRASGRRTSGSGCGSWPTAACQNADGGALKNGKPGFFFTLQSAALLASWPTANCHPDAPNMSTDRGGGVQRARLTVQSLGAAARLAGWPTARAAEAGPDYAIADREKSGGMSLQTTAALASWATPASRDYRHPNAQSYSERGGGKKGEQLPNQAKHLAGWPTAMAGSPGTETYNPAGNTDSSRRTVALLRNILGPARLTASGELRTGSSAKTTSGGPLSPAHSRWLQGYPPEWDVYGVTGIASCRKSPRRSSRRTSTARND
jgi:hypothetical protein